MNIHEAIQDARECKSPIIKSFHKADNTKILVIGVKENVTMKDHKAPSKAKILVVKGTILFKTSTQDLLLNTYDSYDIPLDVTHSVTGVNDAIFLLILSN